jgi:hypothetical protein
MVTLGCAGSCRLRMSSSVRSCAYAAGCVVIAVGIIASPDTTASIPIITIFLDWLAWSNIITMVSNVTSDCRCANSYCMCVVRFTRWDMAYGHFFGCSRLRMSSSVKSSAYAAGGVAVKEMLPVAAVRAATTNSRGPSFFMLLSSYLYQNSVDAV